MLVLVVEVVVHKVSQRKREAQGRAVKEEKQGGGEDDVEERRGR